MLRKNKRFLPLLSLIVCTVILFAIGSEVTAADITIVNKELFKYTDNLSISAATNLTGTATVSTDGMKIDMTSTANTNNCGEIISFSTTTLTLFAKKTVILSVSSNNVTLSLTANANGTILLPAGQSLIVTLQTAQSGKNNTSVQGSVTINAVTVKESAAPKDCAAYYANNIYHDYLDKAIEAVEENGGLITVTQSGTVYHSSVETDPDYYSKTFTFQIPTNVDLLVPDYSGGSNFDEKPDLNDVIGGQSAYRYLEVLGNVIINCAGNICVDSEVSGSGVPVNPHGRITLHEGSQLNMQSGSTLYCYGYITGVWNAQEGEYTTGTVTAENGATVYESLQALGWRGGSVMTAVLNEGQKVKTFAFVDYAVQNIEANLFASNSATVKVIASVNPSGSKVQQAINFATTSSGLMQMGTNSAFCRIFDPVSNKTAYHLYGAITLGGIQLEESGLSLDTTKHIFGLNRNMDLILHNGCTVTVPYEYKLMPGASVTVEYGAEMTITETGKIFIYDTDDYVVDGISYVSHHVEPNVKGRPVAYIAATGATTSPVVDKNTPSGKMVINGICTIDTGGGLYTTSAGGQRADKVITGIGKIVNNSSVTDILTDYFDELYTEYKTVPPLGQEWLPQSAWSSKAERRTKTVVPAVGLIMGLSTSDTDYRCFEAGKTYYGTESGYWYEYTVSTAKDGNPPLPVGYVGNGLTISYTDNVASSVALTYGSYTYTPPGTCYTVTKSSGTCDFDSQTYKLTNVTSDITLDVNANHTYTNSTIICDTCHLFEFKAANIRLGNNLDMMFAFPQFQTDADKNGYFVRIVRNGEIVDEIRGDKWKTTSINDVPYFYVNYSGFSAKEMNDLVSVTVHDSQGKVLSVVWTDSIRHYCDRMLRQATTNNDTVLSTLLADMLNYGAACQKFFGYNTGNMANQGFGATGTTGDFVLSGTYYKPGEDATLADGSVDEDTNEAIKQYFYGDNLIADSKSQFVVGFTTAAKGLGFTYSFTNHWGVPVTRIIAGDDLNDVYDSDKTTVLFHYHPLVNLRIADARVEITIEMNGVTWYDSIESYCQRMIDKSNTVINDASANAAEKIDATNTINVITAFMRFSDAAYDYLHPDKEA